MAWTDIAAFTLDQVFGYQSANQLRDNSIALAAAPFIVKSKDAPHNFLAGAQALNALPSGYLKNTVGTGDLSTVMAIPVADLPANVRTQTLTFVIAHFATPGSGIASGFQGVLVVPWACTITQVTLLSADPDITSGSIVIDIWKSTYATYPPTVANSICGSAKPTLSSAIKSQDSALVGWTPVLAENDVLGFNVNSASGVKRVRVDLRVTLN